jgi:catechol 2,3-dioxygenase-like lactoylglutathione lyase family enzyme
MDHILPVDAAGVPGTGEHSGAPGLDHVTLTVADLPAAQAFYDAALAALAMTRVVDYLDPEDEDEAGVEAVGYGPADGEARLWLVAGAPSTTGAHLALRAVDAAAVDAFFTAGRAAGGRVRQVPRPWAIYRPGLVTAMLVDPDGNVVEAVARG